MKPSSVAINILSDSIVRQKNRVHLLSYTMMNNNHIFYYSIGIHIEETICMVLGIKSNYPYKRDIAVTVKSKI